MPKSREERPKVPRVELPVATSLRERLRSAADTGSDCEFRLTPEEAAELLVCLDDARSLRAMWPGIQRRAEKLRSVDRAILNANRGRGKLENRAVAVFREIGGTKAGKGPRPVDGHSALVAFQKLVQPNPIEVEGMENRIGWTDQEGLRSGLPAKECLWFVKVEPFTPGEALQFLAERLGRTEGTTYRHLVSARRGVRAALLKATNATDRARLERLASVPLPMKPNGE